MILTTERLILRPWEEADAPSLYEFAKDERVGPIAGWPPHKSIESSLGVIKTVFSAPETYAVCMKSDNKAIGCVGIMTGKYANRALDEKEGEIGYWLGVPFWGRGLMPEAVDRMIRHAFCDLELDALWGGYFDGNKRSKRVLEKCGFKFHHTSENVRWALMNDIRTEHMMRLTKEDWNTDWIFTADGVLRIVKIADHPELKNEAAEWYNSKWQVPLEAYIESIEASFGATVPSWYLCLDGKRIVGGMGVIENDFHDRKDLHPNVCAVYTESEYRGRGIAGALLNHVCRDMAAHGIGTLYLLTDHTGFYERYGWRFLCMAQGDGDEKPSRLYVHVS